MTFAEARESHLKSLDAEYQRLRKVVANPEWCNKNFMGYKDAVEKFHAAIGQLCDLNLVEQSVPR